MADIADHGSEYQARMIEIAEANREKPPEPGVRAVWCVECDGVIPAGRRALGYETCVDCAEARERRGKLYGRR